MKAIAIVLAGLCLAGCARTLSEQALGTKAIEVQPTDAKVLTPGIYRIVDGKIRPGKVCVDDFQNRALQIATSTVQSDATITDDDPWRRLSINFPLGGLFIFGGGNAGYTPVTDTNTVEKYKVTRIDQDVGTSLSEYIIKNVGANCRNNYLYGDLLFVEADARAIKYTRVRTGGPSGRVESGIGSGSYRPLEQTTNWYDVTFGVKGEARSLDRR